MVEAILIVVVVESKGRRGVVVEKREKLLRGKEGKSKKEGNCI
jgi:hypothetical protein